MPSDSGKGHSPSLGFRLISPSLKATLLPASASDPLRPPNNEARFPVPALRALMTMLGQQAEREQRSKSDHACTATCELHTRTWSKDLTHLSMVCHYFRAEIFRERWRKVIVRRDDDTKEMLECIPLQYRDAVLFLGIHPDGASDPGANLAKNLTKEFCVHLNEFIRTCPRLEYFTDNIASGRTNIRGLSVESETVSYLGIGLPLMSTGRSQPLAKAFPATVSLNICEKRPCLFDIDPKDTVSNLKAGMGTGWSELKNLIVCVEPVQESFPGQLLNAGERILFPYLAALFPKLETLIISLPPVYTQDPNQACLIPMLLDSMRLHRVRVQNIHILSSEWESDRLEQAIRAHEEGRWIPIHKLLPSLSVTVAAVKQYASINPTFSSFQVICSASLSQTSEIMRKIHLAIDRKSRPGKCLLKVMADDIDKTRVEALNFRYRVRILQNGSLPGDVVGGGPDEQGTFTLAEPLATPIIPLPPPGPDGTIPMQDMVTSMLAGIFGGEIPPAVVQAMAMVQAGQVPPGMEDFFAAELAAGNPLVGSLAGIPFTPPGPAGGMATSWNTASATQTPSPSVVHKPSGSDTVMELVGKHLWQTAHQAAHNDSKCPVQCQSHDTAWSPELTALSSTSRGLRAQLWKKRVSRLVIRVNEDFKKLEEAIGLGYRSAVKTICLASPVLPEGAISPASLGGKFTKRLKSFMKSCTQLDTFIDNNVAGSASTKGPSLESSTVLNLHMGFPSLSVQSKPLHLAFPRATTLSMAEATSNLFAETLTSSTWTGLSPLDYVLKTFGDEILSVKHWRLDAILPDEVRPGQWAAVGMNSLFEVLCERFILVERFEICFAPPFTRDAANACMMPFILGCLQRSSSPVQAIKVITKPFDWQRIHAALASAGDVEKPIKVVDLLPSDIHAQEAFKRASAANHELLNFQYTHMQSLAEKVKVARSRHLYVIASEPDIEGRFFAQMREKSRSDKELLAQLDKHLEKLQQAIQQQKADGGQYKALPHLYRFPMSEDGETTEGSTVTGGGGTA